MSRGNAGWVVIGIISAFGRDDDISRAIVARTGCDGLAESGHLASAKETDCGLLGCGECDSICQIGYRPGDLTAVVAPCEGGPRPILLVLVAEEGGLLKCLIVIDAEYAVIDWRIEDETAHFRSEEACACVPECCVR